MEGNKPSEPIGKVAPSLNGATGWLNSQPLKLNDLRGKVVLVDFWTYTCINWLRTLPRVRTWDSKYREAGLVVIGVHTPEFLFEYEKDNIIRSIRERNITYPVAIDNNYDIWYSFNNNYWPALYLIDGKGRVRYHKFGEGDYDEIELNIQQLLRETGKNIPSGIVDVHGKGAESEADWNNLRSGENFLGYDRTLQFASPGGVRADRAFSYTIPQHLKLNQWSLSGNWTIGQEHITLNKIPGSITYRFHARDLHLIMGPAKKGETIRFRVLIDGKPPGLLHGLDTDADGNGTVKEQRMYQLIRQPAPVIAREFKIEFFNDRVEVYDFTFG